MQLTMIEELRPATQNRITCAIEQAVVEIRGAIELQSVSGSGDVDVAHDIFRSHQKKPFGLAVGGIPDGEVHQLNSSGVVSHERGTTRRESARYFVGSDIRRMWIEYFIVRVRHDNFFPILAKQRHIRFVSEIDDLFICAVPYENRYSPRCNADAFRNEVQCALHGVEISRAV